MILRQAIRMAALVCAMTVLHGCAGQKIRIQPPESIHVSENQTSLSAGLRRTQDMRTEEDRRADDKYDRPRDQIAAEQIYKTLRLSGAFKNVFYEKFSEARLT